MIRALQFRQAHNRRKKVFQNSCFSQSLQLFLFEFDNFWVKVCPFLTPLLFKYRGWLCKISVSPNGVVVMYYLARRRNTTSAVDQLYLETIYEQTVRLSKAGFHFYLSETTYFAVGGWFIKTWIAKFIADCSVKYCISVRSNK